VRAITRVRIHTYTSTTRRNATMHTHLPDDDINSLRRSLSLIFFAPTSCGGHGDAQHHRDHDDDHNVVSAVTRVILTRALTAQVCLSLYAALLSMPASTSITLTYAHRECNITSSHHITHPLKLFSCSQCTASSIIVCVCTR
jgi:hypothetical protein